MTTLTVSLVTAVVVVLLGLVVRGLVAVVSELGRIRVALAIAVEHDTSRDATVKDHGWRISRLEYSVFRIPIPEEWPK